MSDSCFSIVRKPKGFESTNEMTLKRRIEGDDLEECRSSIEEILQNVLDGEKFSANLLMPIINRYQMNRYEKNNSGQDKRIKKLLYILWECLPKRGPDGRFLDKMVMVCGAFDKDLKHPNQYVCGSVLRTLSKTKEPEVIREIVHSIEKCLDFSHAYQRKNALLAISKIHKNFPELNPHTPKLISEYLLKETDDDCKRAALQALLEIDPDEAKLFLHSCNASDIHCMNASIQLLFVELIQKIFKKGSEESETCITILTNLIKSSSSPSVRYQAAATLVRFSREPEAIKLAASSFIDICAKDSDNNVKLITLDSLISLRRMGGAERVLRDSIMDILSILQSAKDLELHERILRLTLDLISPMNVGGVLIALKQEMKKMIDSSIFATPQETVKYRRLLVNTAHQLAERFPHAIVENEMLDTLFDLLICNSLGERISSRLILLFKVFMSSNPAYQATVIKKIQDSFNLVKDNPVIHRGLIQLLGDFSETKEQIEKSYQVIKESLDETNPDQPPPLRSYFLKNSFGVASVLGYALLKLACRYKEVTRSKVDLDKMIAKFMFVVASILNLGHSTLKCPDGTPIRLTNDHSESLLLALNILQHLVDDSQVKVAQLLKKIVTDDFRSQLGQVVKNLEIDRFSLDPGRKANKQTLFDDKIAISLFAPREESTEFDLNASQETNDSDQPLIPDMFSEIPLTGTTDPVYAYCEFDVNQYDIGLKIHLENRTKSKTFENVTLELAARGEGVSSYIDRPESIVLAPRSTACIQTNIKVVSAENRRLFGCIAFDDVTSDDREQFIVLNDISINITDYIKPYGISFDDFRDVWRDCEWENKVNVKTKHTDLKDYLSHLVRTTNMRCVTSDRGLSGDCLFLSANLYARSSFGEEALVNVSIEKESANSTVTGNVKIRSRSQGMALSLGEKIQGV